MAKPEILVKVTLDCFSGTSPRRTSYLGLEVASTHMVIQFKGDKYYFKKYRLCLLKLIQLCLSLIHI